MYICMYVNAYIYIYIYRERPRQIVTCNIRPRPLEHAAHVQLAVVGSSIIATV